MVTCFLFYSALLSSAYEILLSWGFILKYYRLSILNQYQKKDKSVDLIIKYEMLKIHSKFVGEWVGL